MSPRRLALPVLLAAGALVVPAAAQADTTITFKELNKGSTFNLVDNAPKAKNPRNPSLSMGDQLVFVNPVVDSSGARIGALNAECTVTKAAKTFDKASAICFGVFTLKSGTLTGLAYVSSFANTTTNISIVGGSGAYDGARGNVVSKQQKNGDSNDTVTLLG